ncbi:MAG: DUF2336 domain-containing protein [Minwuia sp.]|uniref:DUF2336 domain-containing protein n=1 Tax=Minwuia sp. TaxID=2493630 RepID=UPI003A83EC72
MFDQAPERKPDMSALFDLAHRKSREGRAQLYEDVWNLFEADGSGLNEKERSIMTDILRRLSHDVEMTVRRRLAERLATNPDAPPELAAMLGNDQIEVAYPILMDCKALRDVDLIEIVRHRTLQHQLATAMRSGISPEVSDALVATGNEDVVVALLENQTATMSDALMEHLVAESERVDRYQKPLLRRPDLPKGLAKRMYAWVSAALRTYIVENYRFDPAELDDNVVFAMNDAVRESTGETESNDPSERLVDKLHAAGQLNIAFALKALRQGEVRLFEFAMAKLTQLRVELMRRLVYEPGGEALAISCRMLDMDLKTFLNIFDLTRAARGALTAGHRQERTHLEDFYKGLDRDSAAAVVRRWRQDPDFLSALNQLTATD